MTKRADEDLELPWPQAVAVKAMGIAIGAVCRVVDLVFLLARPRLFRPYFALWLAEVLSTPYRYPRAFETVRALKASGHTRRELMYGEAPLFTAVLLLRAAGLRKGGTLVDLGAGRGRALLAARWLGASARGVELYEPHVRLVSRALASAGVQLSVGDAASADLSGATCVFLNWCAFSEASRREVTELLAQAPPPLRVVAVTCAAAHERLPVVAKRSGLFTWGVERVFIQALEPGAASARRA